MGALFVVLQIISLENHTVENISIQDQWLLIINDQLPTKITPVKYKTKVSNVPTNFWADAYILNQKQTLNNVQEAIFSVSWKYWNNFVLRHAHPLKYDMKYLEENETCNSFCSIGSAWADS